MAEPAEFDAFVAARGPALLRLALMLTGERFAAEDLVQSALAKAYRHWSRVQARRVTRGLRAPHRGPRAPVVASPALDR